MTILLTDKDDNVKFTFPSDSVELVTKARARRIFSPKSGLTPEMADQYVQENSKYFVAVTYLPSRITLSGIYTDQSDVEDMFKELYDVFRNDADKGLRKLFLNAAGSTPATGDRYFWVWMETGNDTIERNNPTMFRWSIVLTTLSPHSYNNTTTTTTFVENLLTNGRFEQNNPLTDWSQGAAAVTSFTTDPDIVYVGLKSLKVVGTA